MIQQKKASTAIRLGYTQPLPKVVANLNFFLFETVYFRLLNTPYKTNSYICNARETELLLQDSVLKLFHLHTSEYSAL